MRMGHRSALLVAAVVLCLVAAAWLGPATRATLGRSDMAGSGHAVHGVAHLVTVAIRADTKTANSGRVTLAVPDRPLTAAETVPVTVVNDTASSIFRSLCLVLERQTSSGWRPITQTEGIPVPCRIAYGVVQAARSRQSDELPLYEDLRPGSYRITLFYRPVPKHWHVIHKLTRRDRFVRALLRVGPAAVHPKPELSERLLLRIAERAATRAGDSHPTLIQHAAGTHFDAARVASGDLVFEWNWSYLIAERGHFRYIGVGPTGITIRGTVITLVVDAKTGEITDAGLSKRYPRLRRLGPVTTDLSH